MSHLRAITRALGLIFVTAAMYLLLVCGSWLIAGFRKSTNQWRAHVFRRWARATASILRLKIAVEGPPPAPPFLLVSNHLSYLDILVFASRIDCVFVARGDLAGSPVIGSLCRAVNTIFVDRERRADVSRVSTLIERALREGRGVVLFAEGTSTQGALIAPFKSSLLEPAARASFPVSYAAISYRTLDGERPAHLSVCWWGKMIFFRHLLGVLQLKEIRSNVVFGAEPIQASNRKVLAEKLRTAVREEFIPVVRLPDEATSLATTSSESAMRPLDANG
ncbi:MAG: 1-acyl-sn-glycerol-3-phosphate acyltransferase [Blastocatellia bacterium]